MPLIDKKKPGLLSRMFNKAEPQPSSLPSKGVKTLGEDGEVVDEPAAGATGRGLFSSRRNTRNDEATSTVVEEVGVVESPAEETSTESRSLSEGALAGLGLRKKAPAAAGVNESAADDITDGLASNEASEQGIASPKKSKSIFGIKKAAKPGEPKPIKAPKEKADKKSKADAVGEPVKKAKQVKPKRSAGAVTSLNILTELGDGGRQLLWTMTGTTLAQITEPPPEVVSFSKEDTRFRTELTLPYAKAQAHAIEEIGEMVAVVNRTKDLRTIYSTREERATASPYEIGAGQQLLDLLLKKTGREEQTLVTGFLLKDASGSTSVVVLYAMTEDGGSSKPQVTVNPDNMTFVLSQFTTSRKIPKDTPQVLFTNEDLLSVAGDLKYFPKERTWNGIPIRVLQNVGAGVTGVIAAGAVGWAATGFVAKASLVTQAAKVKSQTEALTARNNRIIGDSLSSFATNLTENPLRMFAVSQQMWVPDSKVTAEMKSGELKVTVVLALQRARTYNNAASVYGMTDPAYIRQLYEKEAPEGCMKSQPQTNGNLNEIRIDITCQTSDTPFYRYRGD